LLSEQHTASVVWQNVLWPVAVAYFVGIKGALHLTLLSERKSKGRDNNGSEFSWHI